SLFLQADSPFSILELFVNSPFWEERYLLALHPSVTEALLEILSHDGHSYVQAIARKQLALRFSPPSSPSFPAAQPRLSLVLPQIKKYLLYLGYLTRFSLACTVHLLPR